MGRNNWGYSSGGGGGGSSSYSGSYGWHGSGGGGGGGGGGSSRGYIAQNPNSSAAPAYNSARAVTQQQIVRGTIVAFANIRVGWTIYNIGESLDNFLPNNPKCNKFVYDVTTLAGASPGLPNQPSNWDWIQGARGGRPPLASQWADPNYVIPGWTVVASPEPGDVASSGKHVGIVYINGLTISATLRGGVVKNEFGFREGENIVFRRFTGY
jgi:hypothetical protein